MLDDKQYEDLKEIFPTLVLFGDPAQLAPVNQSGRMVFDRFSGTDHLHLERVHRQEADNPILDLAHALGDPALDFHSFEQMIEAAAARDDRVVVAGRVDSDLMARSPVLVWRNATRIRLIRAFRQAHGADDTHLLPGEPLICDGLELPLKHRKRRIDLEARGLIKGAQVVYLGPGRKPGMEAGQQLWKRLAYVAITRAVTRLIWVKRYALAMPRVPLDTSDLRVEPVALTLERQSDDA